MKLTSICLAQPGPPFPRLSSGSGDFQSLRLLTTVRLSARSTPRDSVTVLHAQAAGEASSGSAGSRSAKKSP